MTLKVLTALAFFSLVILEAGGQLAGFVGDKCKEADNSCLDSNNHVCDTSISPPLCKIKAGKGCGRQQDLCVMGATCQGDVCVCSQGTLDSGLCQQAAVVAVTESPETTTTSVMTTEQADGDLATNTTMVPETTTTPVPSGAVAWTVSCLSHAVQLVPVLLLTLYRP